MYNPYYQPMRYQQLQFGDNIQQSGLQPQFSGPQFIKSGLQGKQVDSLEAVKASDVPFDGSITYFPLTDGTAIVTKQLQMDGTSKIVVFKPIETPKEETKFVTTTDLEKIIKIYDEKIKDLEDKVKKNEHDANN